MKDLFETPELIPDEVQAVLETFDEDSGNTYFELARLLNEIEPFGYIFDYYFIILNFFKYKKRLF